MTSLVIVESPNKVRSIAGYLGDGYVVDSSVGHIRDLPRGADEVPAAFKGESWARLGVNVDADFEPIYVVSADKKSQMTKLKKLLKDADELVLATDEDREGEAIAWHLFDELKPKVPVKRIVFNEITKDAIQYAIAHPRDIDMDLVDAQEARRILDRLYGYEVSPVLWKKVMSGLSAGRVQSVATRLVVERERERMAFRIASYWDLEAMFDAGEGFDPRQFPAKLFSVDAKRIAAGSNFDNTGALTSDKVVHLDEAQAGALADALAEQPFTVRSVEEKPYTRRPYAPFRTTTLQQEASRKFGFGAARTMQVAQRLYEAGHITYMRTDSTTLSQTALTAARSQVTELYGAAYLPDKPRVYASKVKNAQEAHEAIRPAGEKFTTPDKTGLSGDERRLYELIWKRTIASQMSDAKGNSVSIRIGATATTGEDVLFSSSGRTITFYGFLKAYVESHDDSDAEGDDQQTKLPNL
ncbi:MAG: type I DNA topoisomerase, partial [Aeromicrobium sp.]